MKPYIKLRMAMLEHDVDGKAIANYINRSSTYVSNRLNNLGSWGLDEAYKILEFLELPEEEISLYFPRNGGIAETGRTKIKRSRSA